jgi:hypothetical protein
MMLTPFDWSTLMEKYKTEPERLKYLHKKQGELSILYDTLTGHLLQANMLARTFKTEFDKMHDIIDTPKDISVDDHFIYRACDVFFKLDELLTKWNSCRSPLNCLYVNDRDGTNWGKVPDACHHGIDWEIFDKQMVGFKEPSDFVRQMFDNAKGETQNEESNDTEN